MRHPNDPRVQRMEQRQDKFYARCLEKHDTGRLLADSDQDGGRSPGPREEKAADPHDKKRRFAHPCSAADSGSKGHEQNLSAPASRPSADADMEGLELFGPDYDDTDDSEMGRRIATLETNGAALSERVFIMEGQLRQLRAIIEKGPEGDWSMADRILDT